MSQRKVANVVGLLLIFLALSMFVTGLVAVGYGEGDANAFFQAGVATLLFGWLAYITTRFDEEVTTREGFAIVTAAWTVTGSVAALDDVESATVNGRAR